LGDAMLVASELVTNAVLHSLCTEEDELVVSVARVDDFVRLSVRDPGLSGQTAKISGDPRWFGGLGLRIVEQLAARWGSQRHAEGYEVWAELPLMASRRPLNATFSAWSS
jgi:serine/threonine-protein kinase RsbW